MLIFFSNWLLDSSSLWGRELVMWSCQFVT